MPSKSRNIFAIVLAAGSATRFGTNKQLEMIGGVPMVQRALRTAIAACGDNVALVVGDHWHAVVGACGDDARFFAINDQHAQGLGSSIAAGVAPLANTAEAIVMLLADQPLVNADHIEELQSVWSGSDMQIVATDYGDTQGPPVLFPRGCFNELASLGGADGANRVLTNPAFDVVRVHNADAALDVDTPADLKRLSEIYSPCGIEP